MSENARKNSGFASMDRAKQKEIASKGGRAARDKGTAHRWTPGKEGTAAEAGRKGGLAVSENREHMAAIGRRGGEKRGAKPSAQPVALPEGVSPFSASQKVIIEA